MSVETRKLPDMSQTIEDLTKQFAIDGVVHFEAGEGGLTRVSITTAKSKAALYTHGAHVTEFQPSGCEPVLWLSGESRFEHGKAIRGGVPLVFPWFGPHAKDPDAPSHGWVRTAEWEITAVEQLPDDDVAITLTINVADFHVTYRVTVGNELTLEMAVANQSETEVSFEQAFHTYLTVGDVRKISAHGLDGTTYIDKLDQLSRKEQADAISFSGETDSVYLDTEATVSVEDPVLGRTLEVRKQGSQSTVVWNPWVDKSKRMGDFGDDEWSGMVCIESGNIADNSVKLAPGQTATMMAAIGVA